MKKIDLGLGDLKIELRKCGNSQDSIIINSDEGDGYSYLKTTETYNREDLDNWIAQLEHVVDYLKNTGYLELEMIKNKKIKKIKLPVVDPSRVRHSNEGTEQK